MFNAAQVRSDFKALQQLVNGKPLTYLDSAATTLKPMVVVDRISKFYNLEAANVHRGAHYLSDKATVEFENARSTIQKFLGASSVEEIIFTRGTTESVNLVAQAFVGFKEVHSTKEGLSSGPSSFSSILKEGDEIVLTELEHHSNIVPWQVLAERKKCRIKYISVLDSGEVDLTSIDKAITGRTKIVAFSACSNILGTLTPIKEIVAAAKKVDAYTFVDGAQYISQKNVDVQSLDVDFLAFSAHKLFGPFGFGVLYVNKKHLDKMPCYQFGGSMISSVDFETSTFNVSPFRFEAGTPHVEGAIGTATAIDYFSQWPRSEIFNHEKNLYDSALEELIKIEGLKVFGTAADKAAILSFTLKGTHHSDIGQILDKMGVAVRVGHHCTQPLLKKFGLTGTVRASFSIYNNFDDVKNLVEAVQKAKRMLT